MINLLKSSLLFTSAHLSFHRRPDLLDGRVVVLLAQDGHDGRLRRRRLGGGRRAAAARRAPLTVSTQLHVVLLENHILVEKGQILHKMDCHQGW